MAFFITQECTGCGSCRRICPTRSIDGEKEQLHTIAPQTCIDCGACGRICAYRAVEDNFGQPAEHVRKKEWPNPRFDKKLCMSCSICIDACPAGVIALGEADGKDPHPYPYLAQQKGCLGCGFCELECPVEAIVMSL